MPNIDQQLQIKSNIDQQSQITSRTITNYDKAGLQTTLPVNIDPQTQTTSGIENDRICANDVDTLLETVEFLGCLFSILHEARECIVTSFMKISVKSSVHIRTRSDFIH
jgi:hypothetical protein